MKLHKFLMAALIFSGSMFAVTSSHASSKALSASFRVRTVPSSADQKKKEAGKANPVKPATTTGVTPCTQKSSQSRLLQSSLWIGNGGKPK